MENGVIAGYPVVDVKVTLYDGSYHEVDSSEIAFKIAGSMGFREGIGRAGPILLEPMMSVEGGDAGRLFRFGDGGFESTQGACFQGPGILLPEK